MGLGERCFFYFIVVALGFEIFISFLGFAVAATFVPVGSLVV